MNVQSWFFIPKMRFLILFLTLVRYGFPASPLCTISTCSKCVKLTESKRSYVMQSKSLFHLTKIHSLQIRSVQKKASLVIFYVLVFWLTRNVVTDMRLLLVFDFLLWYKSRIKSRNSLRLYFCKFIHLKVVNSLQQSTDRKSNLSMSS